MSIHHMQETVSQVGSNSKIDDTTILIPSEKKSPMNVRDKEILQAYSIRGDLEHE